MRYAVIDRRLPQECKRSLCGRGFEIIEMPPFNALSEPVSGHPDMLMFFGDSLICHTGYAEAAKESIELICGITGLELRTTDEITGKEYPSDILLNAARVGRYIYCRKDCVSREISRFVADAGLEIVNVPQGYARCSVCSVTDNAVVTADRRIASAARERGTDVLEISPGGILLQGLSCGFIGGASGTDEENVYFCGNLMTHPDGHSIAEFCKKHGKAAVSLSEAPLFDAGTVFFIG